MKKFLLIISTSVLLILFLLFSITFVNIIGHPLYSLGVSKTPDHITLTWTGDPFTTQTITWRTDLNTKVGIVQYTKDSEKNQLQKNFKMVYATTKEFDSDLGKMNLHIATLTRLEPGTKYVYRVGDGKTWSKFYTFTTEAMNIKHFKFLIFGDSQSGGFPNPDYSLWGKTLKNALRANPDSKFFINVGDLVDEGQSYAHWNNWFKEAKGIIDTIPCMPVEGNHETYSLTGHSTKPIFLIKQFPLPQNGPQGLKEQVYSFDYGNVHFIVLDSQQNEEKSVSGDILKAQKIWLQNDLKNTNKMWKLVFFHKPPYYSKDRRPNEDIKQAFQPIFDKYHVDVVFNGHDHCVARTFPIYNDKFANSPSKGTIYYITGRSGSKYYIDVSKKVWDAFFSNPKDQPNYLAVEVNGNKLTIKAVKQDGTLIDIYTIYK